MVYAIRQAVLDRAAENAPIAAIPNADSGGGGIDDGDIYDLEHASLVVEPDTVVIHLTLAYRVAFVRERAADQFGRGSPHVVAAVHVSAMQLAIVEHGNSVVYERAHIAVFAGRNLDLGALRLGILVALVNGVEVGGRIAVHTRAIRCIGDLEQIDAAGGGASSGGSVSTAATLLIATTARRPALVSRS